MNIAYRINEVDVGLLSSLKRDGYRIYLLNESVVILPIKIDQYTYKIPPGIPGYPVFCIAEEGGRCGTESGFAIIVTTLNGKRLRPSQIPSCPEPLKQHAIFSCAHPIASIEVAVDKQIKIVQHFIAVEHDGVLTFWEKPIWKNHRARPLVKNLFCYSRAVHAALRKSECQMCTHAHFADLASTDLHHTY